MSAPPPLTALPEELIVAISTYVAVGDLLNFALTCKTLRRCAKERLETNARYVADWTVRHDRLPLTVPELLRLTTQHADQVYHLRSLDFWLAREQWSDWKTDEYDDHTGEDRPDWPDPVQDCTDLDSSYFSHEEMALYRTLLRDQLHLQDEEADAWASRIQQGNDEPLKCLLMANIPRLERVNFIALDMARSDEELAEHPLTVLKLACLRIKATSNAIWPPGLQNLRKVSICTGSDLRHPHDAYYMQPGEVTPLFALPNIRVLNLQLLGYHDEDEFDLEPYSSTVEELAFACCEISVQAFEKFVRASRCLRRLGSGDANYRGGAVLDLLADAHSDTIEELVVRPCPTPHDFIRHQGRFKKLRILDGLDVESIEKRSALLDWLTDPATYLPSTIEKLRLCKDRPNRKIPREACEHLRAVAELVENESFAGLTEVCMYDVSHGPRDNGSAEENCSTADWDEAMCRRIRAKGVDIHRFGLDGGPMGYEEHVVLHHNFSMGSLLQIETYPGDAPG